MLSVGGAAGSVDSRSSKSQLIVHVYTKKDMKHIINAAPGLAEHSRVEANCVLVDLREFGLTHS